MSRLFAKKTLALAVMAQLFLAGGCVVYVGGCPWREKYERQVPLSAPIEAGSTLAAETHNGSVTIHGAEVSQCSVTATITAQAPTAEIAQQLAEKTQVTLEPSAGKLTVKIDAPTTRPNESISVSLDATAPTSTGLDVTTHNGALTIEDLKGGILAKTHNGKVTVRRVSGPHKLVTLVTHNGGIEAEQLTGNANFTTHNGSIHVACAADASPACDIRLVTHNGGIELATPPNCSALVYATTHNGSIRTDLPITVQGEVSRSKIQGTIGAGQGRLHVETYNGSITIK